MTTFRDTPWTPDSGVSAFSSAAREIAPDPADPVAYLGFMYLDESVDVICETYKTVVAILESVTYEGEVFVGEELRIAYAMRILAAGWTTPADRDTWLTSESGVAGITGPLPAWEAIEGEATRLLVLHLFKNPRPRGKPCRDYPDGEPYTTGPWHGPNWFDYYAHPADGEGA